MSFLPLDEDELFNRLKAGDESALKTLYDVYWEQLFVSAHNLVKNREICEDILQDIFIKIWTNREKIVIKTSLKGYLHTSVVYKVYDHFRKNKGIIKIELLEQFDKRIHCSNPESQLIHNELVAHINVAIKTIPKKSRIVYKMSREKQWTHKEIAEKLEISPKTVEAHITKSLKVIRESLTELNFVELVIFLLIHDMLP